MSDWPNHLLPPLPVIHTYSPEMCGSISLGIVGAAPGSNVMTQNTAHYQPFRIDVASVAVKLFYVVGATSNGNVDMGVYDSQYNAVVTAGSTAQASANTLQELDITDTLLNPGNYWLAVSTGSTTATFFANSATDEIGHPTFPFYVQASAFPLPTTTATPTKSTASAPLLPLLGLSFDTLI